MYSIRLKPVYSCPASDVPQEIHLPQRWKLSWHQFETLKALRDPNIDVVFNTAMTGDGKSLAAYLDVLQGDCHAIALYPTNALAADQEHQVQEYIAKFPSANELPPRVNRLSGPELEIYAENEGLRKGSAIASRAGQSEVLITNPDIFHYLHRGAYLTKHDNPDKLWQQVIQNFDLFIFDEFHVFSAPQVASVLNTMMLIKATSRHKKFLFLSATPSDSLLERLSKAGFRYREINPIDEGKYQLPATKAEAAALQVENWRQVVQSIDLTFEDMEFGFRTPETWLKEKQEEILRHFLDHPGSKGAIILNSIAAVKRLTPVFRECFAQHGLTVRENTGLSGGQEKAESLTADLVIGTSTIDVGVDFKINFLIFESSDAGNFIQRLGRLGRHDGYQKDGRKIQFDGFKAYALVPKFFVGKLFEGENPVLTNKEVCDRIRFQKIIRDNYRRINDFEAYYKRWGTVQSFKLLWNLKNPNLQYEQSAQRFQSTCEAVFETSLHKTGGRIKGWANEWKTLSGNKGNPIAEDAASFRGSSPLQCGLYDEDEKKKNERDCFKTYDLPGVLSNLEIEMWSKSAFLDTLKETAERTGQPIAKGRFKHCLGFMKLRSYREERLNWKFTYPGDLQPIADAYKVQVLLGIRVWQPDNRWISQINKQLSRQGLVSYILKHPVNRARAELRLPLHFQIYPISDQYTIHDPTPPYSIAFSQSALMLESIAYWRTNQGGDTWIA